MKTQFAIILFIVFTSTVAHCQSSDIDSVRTSTKITMYEESGNQFSHDIIQLAFIANQKSSYLAPGTFVSNVFSRRIELINQEGSSSPFHIFEANLDLRLNIARGRDNSDNFYRRARVTFDYATNFRMLSDESLPLTPGNQQVGLGLDFSLFDNYEGWFHKDKGNSSIIPSRDKNLIFYYLTLQLHHYSNGQGPGHFYLSPSGDSRNDYISGDFSTNYLLIKLTRGQLYTINNSLNQYSISYRRDGSFGNLLSFSEEQRNSFGQNRILFSGDYRSGPRGRKTTEWHQEGDKYKVFRLYEVNARFDYTLIFDRDLSSFNPNILNSTNKFRHSFELFLGYSRLNWRTVGLFFRGYYGRDYLNIRFDDIVTVSQIGITFSPNKYFPAGWFSGRSISKKLRNQ